MMKCEFEAMIGKEVDCDTFAMYNDMYLALPESVDKKQFVNMLNIDAIPEDKNAIERRKQKEELIAQLKKEIDWDKEQIAYNNEAIDRYKSYIASASEGEDIAWYKSCIKSYRESNNKFRTQIKELKMIISA